MNESRNLVDITAKSPHNVGEVICVKCHHRWVAVWPVGTYLKQLECGGCHEQGYVICTGETAK